MSKLTKKQIQDELWRRGDLSWKCHAVQKEMRTRFYEAQEHTTLVWLLARQSGKCRAGDSTVLTPNGIKFIKDIKIGDIVYGYNKDGSISETKVVASELMGNKEVVELTSHGQVIEVCTPDHRWLVRNTFTKKLEEITTQELLKSRHKKILRRFVKTKMGDVNEPHAYTIGALLGDGCCKQQGNMLYISSNSEHIPSNCAKELGCFYSKANPKNYTWCLRSTTTKFLHSKINCNYYNEWLYDRYAHEKTINLDIIKTWDRESCLRLLAGIIDTDGSIYITGRKKNELKFCLGMQAKDVVDVVEWLFQSLWQIKLSRSLDKRVKYKNGPLHVVYSNNNLYVKTFLKELTPHMVIESKKYKSEYESFPERNNVSDYVGLKEGKRYKTDVYDIQVNNDTNLYVSGTGLITHNSWLLSMLALEQCLRQSNSIVKLMTDTKTHAESILEPVFNDLLRDCPEDIKPHYNKAKKTYEFPNKSLIQLAGSDGKHYERLRGAKAALVLVDEAGFCSDLEDAVKSVLMPTTTHTGGKIILASTPPSDPGHDFHKFIEIAEVENHLFKRTIYDNPLLKEDDIKRITKEMGGESSPRFRREFLCEIIKDEDNSIFPEFNGELEKQIVKEWETPPFYDIYVSMDLGFKDLTAVLFSYYDFKSRKLIIQDEIAYKFNDKDNNLEKLTQDILDKEEELYTHPISLEKRNIFRRVSDINMIVTNEISKYSGGELSFMNTRKDDKDAAINTVRSMLSAGQIIISPKCETLIRHLRNAKWNKSRVAFARSADDSHYDFVDAIIYLCRNIDYNRNPYPYGHDTGLRWGDAFIVNRNETQNNIEVFKKIFGIKR